MAFSKYLRDANAKGFGACLAVMVIAIVGEEDSWLLLVDPLPKIVTNGLENSLNHVGIFLVCFGKEAYVICKEEVKDSKSPLGDLYRATTLSSHYSLNFPWHPFMHTIKM